MNIAQTTNDAIELVYPIPIYFFENHLVGLTRPELALSRKAQLARGLIKALISATNTIPSITNRLAKKVIKSGIVGREGTGKSHEMLPFEMDILFKYHEMKYTIEVEHTTEVL